MLFQLQEKLLVQKLMGCRESVKVIKEMEKQLYDLDLLSVGDLEENKAPDYSLLKLEQKILEVAASGCCDGLVYLLSFTTENGPTYVR